MTTYIAVYRGNTVADSRLIAVSTDPGLVADVTSRILSSPVVESDPVVESVEQGRRKALRLIKTEAKRPTE